MGRALRPPHGEQHLNRARVHMQRLVTGGTHGPILQSINLLVRMLLSMPFAIIADALAAKPNRRAMPTRFKAVSGGSAAVLRTPLCTHTLGNGRTDRNLPMLTCQLSPWFDLQEHGHV